MKKKIGYRNLVYDLKKKDVNDSINFTIFGGKMYTYSQLKNGEKTLQQVEKEQKYLQKNLSKIKSGNPNYKSEKQLYTIKNIINLYGSRQKIINLLNDNAKIRSEAIYKSKQNKATTGTGL